MIRAVVVALALAGCGHKGALTRTPPSPEATEAELRAARARDAALLRQGLGLPPEALVIRQDDVLKGVRSRDDPFELPPP
ncbi:MAG: lipoprotein [Sphingomonadaceae bacterium]|uniref:lipoprotein n=1 Tax=Thermaurantiacus sp. TaxID=2820283 RepID=UPI00298F3023|nr:lipoprotein [Thermaurantiacus sp.]MCS6986966.1 lipoprotein [Sphingomonadaceae bacterium]MDW8415434.1 lipoprotein [Thermaurantiacus sp.]